MTCHLRPMFFAPMIATLAGTAPVALFVSVTSSPLVSLAQTEKEQAEEEDLAALRAEVSQSMRDFSELNRSKACDPERGGTVEVTKLDWELLNAKVFFLTFSNSLHMKMIVEPATAGWYPLDLMPPVSDSNHEWLAAEGDRHYFYWIFKLPSVDTPSLKFIASHLMQPLAQIVTEAHVSAHCFVFEMSTNQNDVERRYATFDTDAIGITGPTISVTPPPPSRERREAISKWLAVRAEAKRRIDEIDRILSEQENSDFEQRAKLSIERARLWKIVRSAGPEGGIRSVKRPGNAAMLEMKGNP